MSIARTALFLLLLLPAQALASVPTLAVTYFDNNSADSKYDPLGHGLADMLITDLANLEGMQVVERRRLAEILGELELQKSPFIDPSSAVQVGKGLGAGYVVVGAFTAVEPEMRIDARIVQVSTGQVVKTGSVSGPVDEFFLLEKELAGTITDGLEIAVSARENARLGRVATENFGAFLAYSRGLAALDRGALSEATTALREALSLDDRFGRVEELINDMRARLRSADKKRAEVTDAVAAAVLERVDGLMNSKGPWDELAMELVKVSTSLQFPGATKDLKIVANRLLDAEIPEDVRIGGPQGWMGVNEWALYTYTQSAYWMKDRAEFLTYADAYLERYPASAYAASISSSVTSVLDQMDKEKAGRAQMATVLAEAKASALSQTCWQSRDPLPRMQACEEWVAVTTKAKIDPKSDSLEAWARAALHAGDVPTLDRILALAEADDPHGEQTEDVRGVHKRGMRAVADVDKTRAKIAESIEKGRDPMSYEARLAGDLMDAGRWAEAKSYLDEMLLKYPQEDRFYDLLLAQAIQIHDLAGAEAAIQRWTDSGLEVKSSRIRQVRDLPEQLTRVNRGDAWEVFMLASKFTGAGLYKEAADHYYRLATEFPDSDTMDAPSALNQASNLYGQAWDLEGQWKAFNALMETYPDSEVARSAGAMRQFMVQP